MTRVTLYTKPDCCLCEEVRETIERVRQDVPIELEEVDISADAVLSGRYGKRIPVVLVEGIEAFALRVDEAELRAAIGSRPEAPV